MNQDGSVQFQLGETEIGQGADTAAAQMIADTLGIPFSMVHPVSCQDTDITPFGTGVYASRGTYTLGFSVRQTALLLKEKVLEAAHQFTRMPVYNLDLVDGKIRNLKYVKGCNGNLQAIGRLLEGQDARCAAATLSGVNCAMRGTSCTDQLSRIIKSL